MALWATWKPFSGPHLAPGPHFAQVCSILYHNIYKFNVCCQKLLLFCTFIINFHLENVLLPRQATQVKAVLVGRSTALVCTEMSYNRGVRDHSWPAFCTDHVIHWLRVAIMVWNPVLLSLLLFKVITTRKLNAEVKRRDRCALCFTLQHISVRQLPRRLESNPDRDSGHFSLGVTMLSS